MSTVLTFFEGKKTYIVAFIGAGISLASAIWPEFQLPEWAWTLLGFLGLGALRAAK